MIQTNQWDNGVLCYTRLYNTYTDRAVTRVTLCSRPSEGAQVRKILGINDGVRSHALWTIEETQQEFSDWRTEIRDSVSLNANERQRHLDAVQVLEILFYNTVAHPVRVTDGLLRIFLYDHFELMAVAYKNHTYIEQKL